MRSPRDMAQAWAGRLIALEAARPPEPGRPAHGGLRVLETLRLSQTRLVGSDGFLALQRRALALAQADLASIRGVRVSADGSLEGLDGIDGGSEDAAATILAHHLALLVTFIGEPLTLRLLGDAWPDASLDD